MNKQKQKTLTITLANLVNKAKDMDSFIFNLSNLQSVVDIPERLLFEAVEDTVSLRSFRQLVNEGVWLVARLSGVFVQFSKTTIIELDLDGKIVSADKHEEEDDNCEDEKALEFLRPNLTDYNEYHKEKYLIKCIKRAFSDNRLGSPFRLSSDGCIKVVVYKNSDQSPKDFVKKVQEKKSELLKNLLHVFFENIEISMTKNNNLLIEAHNSD